jgi:hypothetical protein
MSAHGRTAASEGADVEHTAKQGGRRWRTETIVLLLVALLLAIATGNDVVQHTHTNQRLIADLSTWRSYTHKPFHNLSVSQDYSKHFTREVVCGNTAPGDPKTHTQLCLVISGPVRHGRREVRGGWYLPPRVEDKPEFRYRCFGSARGEFQCTR